MNRMAYVVMAAGLLAGCGETASDRAEGGAAVGAGSGAAVGAGFDGVGAIPGALAGDDIRQAQQTLKAQGIYRGPVDGIYGPQTRAAVSQYQHYNGLRDTTALDAETMARLNGTTTTTYGDIGSPDRNAGGRQ